MFRCQLPPSWVCPEMNMFEQASSDYHQMSLAGMGLGISREGWGLKWGGYVQSRMGSPPYSKIHVMHPPPAQTDTFKNITFLQLRF